MGWTGGGRGEVARRCLGVISPQCLDLFRPGEGHRLSYPPPAVLDGIVFHVRPIAESQKASYADTSPEPFAARASTRRRRHPIHEPHTVRRRRCQVRSFQLDRLPRRLTLPNSIRLLLQRQLTKSRCPARGSSRRSSRLPTQDPPARRPGPKARQAIRPSPTIPHPPELLRQPPISLPKRLRLNLRDLFPASPTQSGLANGRQISSRSSARHPSATVISRIVLVAPSA